MMKKLILLIIALPFLEGCGKKKQWLNGLPWLTADMSTHEMLHTLGDTTVFRDNLANKDNAIRKKEEYLQNKDNPDYQHKIFHEQCQQQHEQFQQKVRQVR